MWPLPFGGGYFCVFGVLWGVVGVLWGRFSA
jgi:hypothetical protein